MSKLVQHNTAQFVLTSEYFVNNSEYDVSRELENWRISSFNLNYFVCLRPLHIFENKTIAYKIRTENVAQLVKHSQGETKDLNLKLTAP